MSLLSRLAVQAARAYGILSSADKTKVVADYLVVAGGGGSGATNTAGGSTGGAGGGGAGGFKTSTATLSTLNTYSITVGAGGNGSTSQSATGSSGSNSALSGTGLSTITSTGGGGGGSVTTSSARNGLTGGSGGGGGATAGVNGTGGSGTSGQGNAGGNGITDGSSYDNGGGGGGASAVGANATSAAGGNGGAGTASSISGSSVTYAGGGGGSAYPTKTQGTGGAGGGGNSGSAGTVNTGGGAGGGIGSGNAGGSGIVIISYTSATPKFVGGTITTSGGKQIHTFTSSGTLSPITPITASYLVVAGGGGGAGHSGASRGGGGGGAGGYLESTTTLYSGATYIVTVGAGGTGAGDDTSTNGSNSVLSGTGLTTLTSVGGGAGKLTANGATGGSGGGGGYTTNTGGSGTSGQGYAGGNGGTVTGSASDAGGGGGGAGGIGGNGSSSGGGTGGTGGAGVASSITGTSVSRAGGGGGGNGNGNGGTATAGGGTGGGTGGAGTPNSGGGGGGKGLGTGGNGGSGTVIISYAGSQAFNGGLVTSSGGNTIHTFTSTGALTPLTNNLNNSLRFRSSASAYLNRTPTVSSNQKTWTWSGWVKRGTLNSSGSLGLFEGFVSPYNSSLRFGNDGLNFQQNDSAGRNIVWATSAVFRDPSAWYHIVMVCDTTQATMANAVRIYINGNQQTVTATAYSGSYAQNLDTYVNSSSASQRLGTYYGGSYFDGYLADVNFIDGQALEPYYFGNNDANGVWKPILYKGTYGTNGFYLTFGNTTSTTTLGYDSSPNGNNWTTNNISLTAGTTYDAMTDVPTNTSATVANYAVLNPIAPASISATIADGNLKATGISTGTFESATSTMSFTSGKIYFEATCLSGTGSNASAFIGISNIYNATSGACFTNSGSGSIGWDVNGTTLYTIINTTLTSRGAITPTNKVFRVAYDSSTGNIWLGYDTTWIGGGDPSTLTTPTGTLTTGVEYICGVTVNTSNDSVAVNFGQRPFAQTIPTNFVALNTYNLPTPTILQGNKYMDATLWTSNAAASQVIVNQGQFKPDFIWAKNRSASSIHILSDSVRGVLKHLSSNDTTAEAADDAVQSFNSNGFTSGTWLNTSTNSFVGWQWQAGQGSTSSNTSGSITSTVSVNTTAGFSVVTYTGTGANATVGHGLGVAPRMIIAKRRNTTQDWGVYHASVGNTGALALNLTIATDTNIAYFNNTSPTSSVFSVGTGSAFNANTGTYVAYCWADVSGYSKAFSYTGNGSTDGSFVYTGFLPRFVLIKRTDTTGDWYMWDTARNTYDVITNTLLANSSAAETSATSIDALSNGFKLRNTTAGFNASGGTYIGMAWATNPFKNSNAF